MELPKKSTNNQTIDINEYYSVNVEPPETNPKLIDNELFFYLTYGLDAGLIGYLVAGIFVTVLYCPFFGCRPRLS